MRGLPTSPSSPLEEGRRNLFHLLLVECPGVVVVVVVGVCGGVCVCGVCVVGGCVVECVCVCGGGGGGGVWCVVVVVVRTVQYDDHVYPFRQCVHRIKVFTPGSQTPGVPATSEPSMTKNFSSSRAHLALNSGTTVGARKMA